MLCYKGVTEIAGESASAKTQLALQLLLQVQLPPEMGGLGGAAYYLSTEGDFASSRLQQVSKLCVNLSTAQAFLAHFRPSLLFCS